jgi:hypothetical protein
MTGEHTANSFVARDESSRLLRNQVETQNPQERRGLCGDTYLQKTAPREPGDASIFIVVASFGHDLVLGQ